MSSSRRWLLPCAFGLSVWTACTHDRVPPVEPANERAQLTPLPGSREQTDVSVDDRAQRADAPADNRVQLAEERAAQAAAAEPQQAAAESQASPSPAAPQAKTEAAKEKKPHDRAGDAMGALMGIGSGGGGHGLAYGRAALAIAPAAPPPFNREAYEHIAETGFRPVRDEPLSTFSVDVDTASYSNVWDPLESTCRHASLSIL